jgi:curli biogenesis system outer membrane secretion channel CsgG
MPAAISVQVMKPADIHMPGVRTLAVADFQGAERSGSQIATQLQSYLKETEHFDLVERDQLRRVLDEQKLGMAGVVNEETAVEVGKLLGVEALIFGEVTIYEVEPDERGTEKVAREEGTGKYEWVEQKNIFTGKKHKVKKEIMKTVLVDQHYRIRRGTVAINFRVVSVQTGELLAVHSDSKSYNSGKVVEGSRQTLKPQGEILSELSEKICKDFVWKIAPHYSNETRYVESGKGKIATGKKYAESGLWPEAIEMWQQAIVETPKEAAGYYNLGVACEIRGDYDQAESYYKQAVAIKTEKRYLESIQRVRKAREEYRKLQQQIEERDAEEGESGDFF